VLWPQKIAEFQTHLPTSMRPWVRGKATSETTQSLRLLAANQSASTFVIFAFFVVN
jgi:hypothetical protein